ncbi:MAG: DUF1178 family protein [Rhodospirillaceae bacterium]|nr:DUF1178 family protein [Rhodospirillaceae bacterium]MBT5039201.1 DUF1178 family protein [Rhodospirillaceae bacterium]MBT5674913.1 DUF1178 family protein [Rhodospirillaceae bacterium]MBT5778405.1 DUF1178 family protein [Rhodospirillaceae bacterium]MBT6827954.1 DUF1178 family protein [Rhodospirillaceae bacterium]
MIVFDLKCPQEHVFEAWFADSGSFESQVADGEVECPVCGDQKIEKAPMAPNIPAGTGKGRGRGGANSSAPVRTGAPPATVPLPPEAPTPEQMGAAIKTLRKMRDVVEKNFDNVGENFPEEARKIHHGEVEKRNIYGDASKEEAAELAEEGIEVNQMPWLPRHDS